MRSAPRRDLVPTISHPSITILSNAVKNDRPTRIDLGVEPSGAVRMLVPMSGLGGTIPMRLNNAPADNNTYNHNR